MARKTERSELVGKADIRRIRARIKITAPTRARRVSAQIAEAAVQATQVSRGDRKMWRHICHTPVNYDPPR